MPLDETRALRWLADLSEAAARAGLPRLAALAGGRGADATRLAAVLDLSPHLNAALLRHPEWLDALFDEEAGERIERLTASLDALPRPGTGEKAMMAELRLAKAEISLLVALRDLFGAADCAQTTRALSALAEGALRAALRFCLLDLHGSGKIALPHPEAPERGCGLFVLGMGKLGGGELNYSSDIDLIVLFEPQAGLCRDPLDAGEIHSRLVRRLIRLMAERTAEGYVFRMDLRLRPDPGAMPLAIEVPTALVYYEGSGRNWERAAMIKARPVAGDIEAGLAFLDELSPFVWRRYLDFAAIAEIQSMKDRIDTHRGFDEVSVAGHNVKLGRGGIREVEFFAQGQQLIAGGRAPALRSRRTDETLAALAEGGWISRETETEMVEDYWFLRRVEHGVQMIADEQTHTLPADADGIERVARLLCFPDAAAFGAALLERLRRVDARFSQLFNEGRERGGAADEGRSLAVRLLSGDEGTDLHTELERYGFARPGDILRIVRGWGYGRYRATRSQTARDRLADVLPRLLAAFARAPDPDASIAALDKFLGGLPAGIQFFSLIASNPRILDLLAAVITAAPALRETLSARPHVFDALLDPAFYAEIPERAVMAERLDAFLGDADGYEDVLARLRIFSSEQRFLVGTRLLSGTIDPQAAGRVFSEIADLVLSAAFEAVAGTFAQRHGTVPGASMALLGMGKLGSREMTARSDVDLILLYDHAPDAEESDGEKPLAPTVYFARLTQRLIAALTAPMREGVLYEVDFRLRPSGNKGPLATHFDAFVKYQRGEARTWEHMALTRSRPIAGDAGFSERVRAEIQALVCGGGDRDAIGRDVAAMRRRLDEEKPPRGVFDLKLRPGGLIDLEFVAQWAILSGRAGPRWIGCPTAEVLAAADLGAPQAGEGLARAMADLTGLTQLLKLGPPEAATPQALPQGLSDRVAEALGTGTLDEAQEKVDALCRRVRADFERLLPFAVPA
ncbi:bifunctional glutamine-synthetase adenylyltransferase/deadenyltransferase [Aurantimonas sp. Leaf443]|nr:bifunctional glutamine-synthetase adenylyltransferase/deadenyltransferase [Aurantimonas sp. Leaf443]